MLKLFLAAIIFTICNVAFVAAQTATDIESKYGKPYQMYEVRPGVFMNVKFAADGQASEIRVERHNLTNSTVYLDTTLPWDLAKGIVNELVPMVERGARNESAGGMFVIGGSSTRTEVYENVSITYQGFVRRDFSGGIIGIIIKWKNQLPKQK